MQPLGRKKIQMPVAKWHPKECGKHIAGWWENICKVSKRSAKFQVKREIRKEIDNEA